MLTVDKSLVNDVREQDGLEGEDLSVRRLSAEGMVEGCGGEDDNSRPALTRHSTIRIKPSVT